MSRAWPVDDVDPEAPVIDNARRVLAVRIAEFYSFEPVVAHPELSEALHDMRISAKRLRYTLELFRPQFGKAGERQIERVKAIQEALGTLHDHDVRIDLIGDELSQLMVEQSRKTRSEIADASPDELAAIAAAALRPPPDDPRRGLIALLGREHAGRRTAYARFRELWDDVCGRRHAPDLVALSVTPLPDRRGARSTESRREWHGANELTSSSSWRRRSARCDRKSSQRSRSSCASRARPAKRDRHRRR